MGLYGLSYFCQMFQHTNHQCHACHSEAQTAKICWSKWVQKIKEYYLGFLWRDFVWNSIRHRITHDIHKYWFCWLHTDINLKLRTICTLYYFGLILIVMHSNYRRRKHYTTSRRYNSTNLGVYLTIYLKWPLTKPAQTKKQRLSTVQTIFTILAFNFNHFQQRGNLNTTLRANDNNRSTNACWFSQDLEKKNVFSLKILLSFGWWHQP